MFSLLKRREKLFELKAPVSGKVIPVSELKDGMFSEKLAGDGIAIYPENDTIISPANGRISMVMKDSKHACSIDLENGLQILLHIGLDTIEMNGEGFELFVHQGDRVKIGEPLIKFDAKKIEEKGYINAVILVIPEGGKASDITFKNGVKAIAGESTIATYK